MASNNVNCQMKAKKLSQPGILKKSFKNAGILHVFIVLLPQ